MTPPAVVSLRMQFCAGPEKHTFFACEEHRATLKRGDVSCFLRLTNEALQPVDPDDEIGCDLCREGGD